MFHGEQYFYSYGSGILTDWRQGERPVMFKYQYNFGVDLCGHVYCKNLPGVLAGTAWEYCPISLFYGHIREPMELLPFLQELGADMGTLQAFQGYAGMKDRQRLLRWTRSPATSTTSWLI